MSEGPKIFTFEEARRLLPQVREHTQASIERIGAAHAEIEIAEDEEDGGEHAFEKTAAEILGEWAGKVRALGIEVKGPWLIDFDSGSGYFCWKWPEESLEFFHGYDEGFSGRVRIQ
ncbi:MAG: DUF2203 family protein [Thermoanaerobaculia bacterium]